MGGTIGNRGAHTAHLQLLATLQALLCIQRPESPWKDFIQPGISLFE
jgi:hypothetical protein